MLHSCQLISNELCQRVWIIKEVSLIHKPSFARVRPCILLANERWKIMIDLGSHCP